MLVSEQRQFVFLHIEKTGGTSIRSALQRLDPAARTHLEFEHGKRHIKAEELRRVLGPETWCTHYTFAFVRNPWDRLVSWYHHAIQRPAERFMHSIITETTSFEEFILRRHDIYDSRRLLVNQVDYLSDNEGKLIVDYVGRFERLAGDFDTVIDQILSRSVSTECGRETRRLKKCSPIPTNQSDHDDYRSYYNDKTAEIVTDWYARDVVAFGYQFE